MFNKKRGIIIIVLIIMVIAFFMFKPNNHKSSYVPVEPLVTNASGEVYVGYSACIECHSDIVKTHLETAHFKTSSLSNLNTIKGSFKEGDNTFKLNDDIVFKMVSDENGQFQEAYHTKDDKKIYSFKFDINIGSGTKGQTYLTWLNGGLYQQQISYYTPSNSWINSPMYPKERFVKPRPVIPQCIGCHATYAESFSAHPQDNRYFGDRIVYGVDCERCHGPAAKHVELARQGKLNKGNSIIKFSNLNKQQRLDACAVCHSGLSEKTQQGILKYKIGDKLLHNSNEVSNNEDLDVHGNQYGLLIQSECFKKSEKMDCMTCHNVHKNERGNYAKFNAKCVECHSNEGSKCDKMAHDLSNNNCVECHMPLMFSKVLQINDTKTDSIIPLAVRTHLIKKY